MLRVGLRKDSTSPGFRRTQQWLALSLLWLALSLLVATRFLSTSPIINVHTSGISTLAKESAFSSRESGNIFCNRLAHSISRAGKGSSSSVFPPPSWAETALSRAPSFDMNYTNVSTIINDQGMDVPFELGPVVNRSIPTFPFFVNASEFHPCCAPFLTNATEQTFQNVEFDIADFFRALGNNSRLLIAGDSVSRGSAQSALCALVAAGADFHYMKWEHPSNADLQNQTRDNGGHAPTICKTWFRSWSSFHNFSLPHPSAVAEARIPLEGLLLSSMNSAAEARTFHQLVWITEARGDIQIPNNSERSRVALLLNFGLWWNLGGSVNNNLKFEDDSPSRLYNLLVAQFERLALHPDPPFVFWRETNPQLFPSFEVDRSRAECEKFPDIYVGGSFPDGGCVLGSGGWNAGPCQRNNSQSLGWNRASPYRWRQRLAAHAAKVAGLRITLPPVRSQTVNTLVKERCRGSGEVLWLPFHDAALQDRSVYQESGDCVHPDPFRRAFWSVLWDGMARHIIDRCCCSN